MEVSVTQQMCGCVHMQHVCVCVKGTDREGARQISGRGNSGQCPVFHRRANEPRDTQTGNSRIVLPPPGSTNSIQLMSHRNTCRCRARRSSTKITTSIVIDPQVHTHTDAGECSSLSSRLLFDLIGDAYFFFTYSKSQRWEYLQLLKKL